MTRSEAESAVWRHFPRRTRERWNLSLVRHHTSTRRRPVWQWELTGTSATQDRHERWGFVDESGVEVVT
jgi:hypothetical protein